MSKYPRITVRANIWAVAVLNQVWFIPNFTAWSHEDGRELRGISPKIARFSSPEKGLGAEHAEATLLLAALHIIPSNELEPKNQVILWETARKSQSEAKVSAFTFLIHLESSLATAAKRFDADWVKYPCLELYQRDHIIFRDLQRSQHLHVDFKVRHQQLRKHHAVFVLGAQEYFHPRSLLSYRRISIARSTYKSSKHSTTLLATRSCIQDSGSKFTTTVDTSLGALFCYEATA